MPRRTARAAGSHAASSVAPTPSAIAVAIDAALGTSRTWGAITLKLSAVAVTTTGSSARASTSPSTTPSDATLATPIRNASFICSRQIARGRAPIAASTPSCHPRRSKPDDTPLNAIRYATSRPTSPIARSRSPNDCMTRWRSTFRCTGVVTCRPGSAATIAARTASTLASRRTTTSTRLTMPRAVKTSSAAATSITTRLPPYTRATPAGSSSARIVNVRRPRGVSSSIAPPSARPRRSANERVRMTARGFARNRTGSSMRWPDASRAS